MRLVWPDLARGVAVLSMFVAHVGPGGGPIVLSEYLTAPLFATLVVISLVLSWRQRRVGAGRWYLIQALRGAILVILGMLLQPIYAQIVVVLQALGVLTVVAAAIVPLLDRRPRLALAAGLATALVSPLIMAAARQLSPESLLLRWWLDVLATGHSYRVITFMAFGLLGIALIGFVGSPRWSTRVGLVAAGLVTAVAVAVLAYDQLTGERLEAYSGTTFEILFDALLVAGVVLWSAWFQERFGAAATDRWWRPVTATGRLALTAYTLQLLVLAGIGVLVLHGGPDDSWAVLAVLTVSVVGFCLLWDRLGWVRPVESLLRLPQVLSRRRPG